MSLRLSKVCDDLEIERIRVLYEDAFPADEKAPFKLLKRKGNNSNVDWLSILDDDRWLGFFYVIRYNRIAYVFYFAIDESNRGKGYGTRALKLLMKRYRDYNLFLAIERVDEDAPNIAERIKRKQFYMTAGLQETGKIIQEASVSYEVLASSSDEINNQDYKRLMSTWCHPIMMLLIAFKMYDRKEK